MSDIEDFGGPINRPASNARQGTPGDLGHTPHTFGQDAEDFLGLDGGPASVSANDDPFAQPAVPPPTPPSESWLLESADEAPVTIPRSIAAPQAIEPPALLNTSWSEPERKSTKGRWVGALLGAASLGVIALVGYPRLTRRVEPVQERGPQVAQPTRKPQAQPTDVDSAAALAQVADDLDTPGAIEPADEYSAPLAISTPTERVLVGREPEEAQPTTALEDNGLVEVVDPTAESESASAEALSEARKERRARRQALKAQEQAQRLEHELALAAMNADCEPEAQAETSSASLLEIASTLGDKGPTEVEPLGENSNTNSNTGTTTATATTPPTDRGWPGVSWLDEIERLVAPRKESSDESTTPTDESTVVAPESGESPATVTGDVDTTWLEFEGSGTTSISNEAEAEVRAEAKRERRAAARAARWRAREEALEAARVEHEAALAAMNADCAQEPGSPRALAKASNEVFWTPALGELPLPGSWAETAPQAPIFDALTDESSAAPTTQPAETVTSETATSDATAIATTPSESAPLETATLETAPSEATPLETATIEATPSETTPLATPPIDTTPVDTTPVEPTPIEPVATPAPQPSEPVATSTAPSEPTRPFLGPPAPNGVPPATPTGIEGTATNDTGANSGNARVTQLTEQDVVQPTRAKSIVRAAPNDERKGTWDEESIPLDQISRKTRLLTPKVGKVRATLNSGELFEGTLYAVGEECVWLDTSYGRMGLSGARVKSVVRIDVPKDPSKPDAPKTPQPERVHIKTPGGTVAGQLLEDDGKHAIVLTDSGARVTVDSASVQRLGEQAPAVRVQQRKQP